MIRRVAIVVFPLILVISLASADELPDPKEIVDRVIAAAGGEAFSKLGILELEIEQEETRNDGTSFTRQYTLLVDSANLSNGRIEYPGNVVIGATARGGWSTVEGVIDDRPQTPSMARKNINQVAFPHLLPFSLRMNGVWVKDVREMTWEDQDAWVLTLPFSKGFFVNPILETYWFVVVAKDDYSILAAEFIPPVQFRKVSPEGVRYRILTTEDVSGARVPTQVLAIGIDVTNMESGHHRVTKLKPSLRAYDPTFFLSPAQIDALEQED
jgi:hypothetical protein